MSGVILSAIMDGNGAAPQTDGVLPLLHGVHVERRPEMDIRHNNVFTSDTAFVHICFLSITRLSQEALKDLCHAPC